MKALLLTASKKLQLTDMPAPDLDDDTVLVRVAACGICGSDVHGFDGSTGRRIPPLVMGHEASGIVEAIGSAVDRFAVGDRVTFDSTIHCGDCDFCRRGSVNLCNHRQVLGVSCGDYRRHGAFAELVAVPQRVVYRLPDSFPFEQAALIEAVSVAVHAVESVVGQRITVDPEQPAVVVGTGMIGLLIVQSLRATGRQNVIAVDVADARLQLAKQFGASSIINAKSTDAVAMVRKSTDWVGAPVVLEAVGMTETVHTAIESASKGGLVALVGNVSPTVDLPLQSVVTREITVVGSCASAGEYPRCIELMASGAIDVAPLISATAPLAEGPNWFERLYRREPGLMKVVLTPGI